MKRKIAWLIALALAFTGAGMAEMIYDGKVAGDATVSLCAPLGGEVAELSLRAGDRVKVGDSVAKVKTTYVYAPVEGTVTGLFGQEGDATESVTERYGAVVYIEPTNKYTIAATTEKAYNDSANKFIHVGETVYMRCTADGTHMGTGRVISVAEDGGYKIEAIGGEFCIAENVGVFRKANYETASRIGLGSVKATSAVGVKGSGSIIKMHVKNGDFVERGELLFETAEGALNGLFAPAQTVISEVAGIVTAVDAANGAAVALGAKILTVLPDENLYVEIHVPEADLGGIQVGAQVLVDLLWNVDAQARIPGEVTRISYLNGAETGAPTYAAQVRFTPDDTVRLGMSALVYVPNEVPAAEKETPAQDDVPDLSVPEDAPKGENE